VRECALQRLCSSYVVGACVRKRWCVYLRPNIKRAAAVWSNVTPPEVQSNRHYLRGAAPLERYFDNLREGPGLVKWRHYFGIYEQHLARFRGTDVHLAEVGVYSGGSLRMWRHYLGPRAKLFAIDISPATRIYERNPHYGNAERVFIGDQASPAFWARFRREVPRLDVLIDDGGHSALQQWATLDCIFPHLSVGGVHLIEDVFSRDLSRQVFDKYASNPMVWHPAVAQVTFHNFFVVALEKLPANATQRVAKAIEKHGTLWQPEAMVRQGLSERVVG